MCKPTAVSMHVHIHPPSAEICTNPCVLAPACSSDPILLHKHLQPMFMQYSATCCSILQRKVLMQNILTHLKWVQAECLWEGKYLRAALLAGPEHSHTYALQVQEATICTSLPVCLRRSVTAIAHALCGLASSHASMYELKLSRMAETRPS